MWFKAFGLILGTAGVVVSLYNNNPSAALWALAYLFTIPNWRD